MSDNKEEIDIIWTDNLERDLANLERVSADIERKILNRVERVDAEFEKLQEENPIISSFPNKVKLDVGGQLFRTSVEVLTREQSFFSSMFSGVYDLQADEFDGSYFIDRDPKYMDLILEFCRTGKIRNVKKLPRYDKEGLLQDAEFYGMATLVEYLGGGLADYDDMQWDSQKKHSSIALSNGNMTAMSTTSCSHKTVLGSIPIEDGGITWEVVCNISADCYSCVGLVGEGFNHNGTECIGRAANTWGVGLYPNIDSGDRRSHAVSRLNPGQVVKGIYDADAHTLKILIDGQERGNWTNVNVKKAYICLTVCCNTYGGGYTLRNVEAF